MGLQEAIQNIWSSDYVQKNPNKAYKVSYASEYAAVAAFINGGAEPDWSGYSKLGKGLCEAEKHRRTEVVVPPIPPDPPPAGFITQEVDGGANYYAQFSNPLPSDPSYFPIGAWFRRAMGQSDFDHYASFGMNLFVGVENPEGTQESLIRSNGMKALMDAGERTRFNDLGAETVGWVIADEMDMCCGPPGFAGGNGYDKLTATLAGLPQDGKARYANYGKGVMFWETDAQAAQFVNQYQQLVSNDIYWFTDPNDRTGRGSSYGETVTKMRRLDAMDGKRKPIWNFVELGWPFTESAAQGGRRILPAEVRSAVWHSIIAGARGIIYFDHNFGPGSPGSTILGEGYEDTRVSTSAVNAQIKSLAPALNSPTITGGFSYIGNVKAMAKLSDAVYVFAGCSGVPGSGTFTIPSLAGKSATVVGESRSVSLNAAGSFSDSFADGNAVHIYRVA